ncbi:magnesium chelatase subunit D family protein [Dendrosporobacter sp. 1207_IL3150]|uniref:magnesium chelatase subunit D family protein n=1 Tax=Dendrosporobacter sp. 1207_IL3150 TaxID=3084054 RepID=UPI002FDB575F
MVFPFAAVVGQEQVKQALLIAAVNPKAGGLLLNGVKGAAKSTLVRGLANLLEGISIVELPLNATEDMVFGSIDIQKAIKQGVKSVAPGILAKADNNILYIDEINLLRREIVSGILNAASTGTNIVEREGISCCQNSRFIMIGSMNPEEGSLPPQLLDRFGMVVNVVGEQDIALRAQIIRRFLAYEIDPAGFNRQFQAETLCLQQQLAAAKQRLPYVELSEAMVELTVQQCCKAQSAGHRAELFLVEAAKAIAALAERLFVSPDDVAAAAKLVLPHRIEQQRMADSPSVQPSEPKENEPAGEQDDGNQNQRQCHTEHHGYSELEQTQFHENEQNQQDGNHNSSAAEHTADIGMPLTIGKLDFNTRDRIARQGTGKRSLTRTDMKLGRYVRVENRPDSFTDLALDATLRAAAPYQRSRPRGNCALTIYRQDWRKKIREKHIGTTFLFVVDASGSMGARQRMKAVKGTVLALLQDAYQKRDKVGLIAFRRDQAELLLPVTRSVDLAQKCLKHMPTGGKTPLAAGLTMTLEVIQALKRRDKDGQPVVVLVTDGRANSSRNQSDAVNAAFEVASKLGTAGVHSLIIDTEHEFIKLGIAEKIAQKLGGAYCKIEELSTQSIIRIVNNLR